MKEVKGQQKSKEKSRQWKKQQTVTSSCPYSQGGEGKLKTQSQGKPGDPDVRLAILTTTLPISLKPSERI
jgi:hypothetical protein